MANQGEPEQISLNDGADQGVNNTVPTDNSHLLADAGYLSLARNGDSTRMTEVERGLDMLSKGNFDSFRSYFLNNPESQQEIKSALSNLGIELHVQNPPLNHPDRPIELTLSTPIKSIEPLQRALVLDGKNAKAQLLFPAGANFAALESRYKANGNIVSVDSFKQEIQRRLPQRSTGRVMPA